MFEEYDLKLRVPCFECGQMNDFAVKLEEGDVFLVEFLSQDQVVTLGEHNLPDEAPVCSACGRQYMFVPMECCFCKELMYLPTTSDELKARVMTNQHEPSNLFFSKRGHFHWMWCGKCQYDSNIEGRCTKCGSERYDTFCGYCGAPGEYVEYRYIECAYDSELIPARFWITRICPQCGYVRTEHRNHREKFCTKCGYDQLKRYNYLGEHFVLCTSCGKKMDEAAFDSSNSVCPHCGGEAKAYTVSK